VQQQWTTTSRLLANPGSPTEPHPRLRNGHPDVQGVQLQRPNMSFACTECFGPLNIEKTHYGQESRQALLFKQPQKTIMKVRRSTLKILKSKTRKRDNQYSECDDKEETYAYYNETLWNKMCPHVRLFINYVLCQECNNYLQVYQECNNHALCQECNNYQQLKLSAKNVTTTLSVKNATTTSN